MDTKVISFRSPSHILAGMGTIDQLKDEVKGFNAKRALLVTDKGILQFGLDQKAREQLQDAVVGVGRPIFLTTTTTCVSFLALLFTDHAGLESIANFMLVGVPMCFLTSVTMVPAAAMIFLVKDKPVEV